MKLLIDCSRLSVGGGVQAGLSAITSAAVEPDVELSLICSEQVYLQIDELTKKNIKNIIMARSGLFGIVRSFFEFREFEEICQPDIIFTVFGPSYWKSRTINVQGFALGKMLYPEIRRLYPSRFVSAKERVLDEIKAKVFKWFSDFYVVETEIVRERLSLKLSVSPEKIFVIGNACSPAFEAAVNSCLPGKNKIAPGKFNFFVPASFYQHKNLLIIPQVAKRLQDLTGDGFVFIFTLDESSAGWSKILSDASDLGVSSMILSVGQVDNKDIANFYINSDAVICVSLVESSTAVFPETFKSQRPLIASDRDFARALCGDGALYVDPLSVEDIVSAIIELASSEATRERLVLSGSRALKNNYPSAEGKWSHQLSMLKKIIAIAKVTS